MPPRPKQSTSSKHSSIPKNTKSGVEASHQTNEQASHEVSFHENAPSHADPSLSSDRPSLTEANLRANHDTGGHLIAQTSRTQAIQRAADSLGFEVPRKYFEEDRRDKEGWLAVQAAFYGKLKGD